jgi:primosomal protein N' (replication factor Y)
MTAAGSHDYEFFFQSEIALREEMGYPPFARLALVRLSGRSERATSDAAEMIGERGRAVIGDKWGGELELFGPAPSPITKLREKFRYQLMLRAKTAQLRHKVLLDWIPGARRKLPEGIVMTVDVDPYNLL